MQGIRRRIERLEGRRPDAWTLPIVELYFLSPGEPKRLGMICSPVGMFRREDGESEDDLRARFDAESGHIRTMDQMTDAELETAVENLRELDARARFDADGVELAHVPIERRGLP